MLGFGRLYTVTFENIAVTAQQDFFYVKPAADKPIFVEEVKIATVGGAADAGDAQEELLSVVLCYVPATVTASSGGSTHTPAPLMPADTAAGFTARINDTTKATSSGTILNRDPDGMNSRIPYLGLPAPEHRIWCANAAAVTCRLNTTPADSIAMNGRMLVRELG